MKVFVDSNQFIADFLLESAPMRYLFHYLNNSRHELLLSRLVIQEVENKHLEKSKELVAEAERVRGQLSRLGAPRDARTAEHFPAVPALDLLAKLNERVDRVKVVEYGHLRHEDLVERALARRKPFDADGQDGYRDCLLWLSLLDVVENECNGHSEIAFVSDNWTDFYDRAPRKDAKGRDADESTQPAKASASFHQHLAEDLRTLNRVIVPYQSLSAFVDSKVDKTAHALDLHKEADDIEPYVESKGLEYLRNLGPSHAKAIARSLLGDRADGLTIISTDADTLDGSEDLDIDFAEAIDGELFVGCHYNIRAVNLDLHVPLTQLDLAERIASSDRTVWDVARVDETVVLRLYVRAYFSVRFRLDPVTKECSGYSVDQLDVRQS